MNLHRTIIKTIVWKLVGILILVLVGLMFGVSAAKVSLLSLVYHVITLMLYFVHERIWAQIDWGQGEVFCAECKKLTQ